MKQTMLLLKAEWRMMFNSMFRSDKKGIKRLLFGLIGVAAMVYLAWLIGVGVSSLITFVTGLLSDYPELVMMTKVNILSAMALALFFLMFITGFTSIYSSLFESGDMRFLMGTPVGIGSIYSAKFLKAFWTNLVSILPFNLPVWIGFGLASDVGPMYYIMTVVAMILAVLMFTSVVAMVVMMISRYVSSQKMKQLVMVGSLVLGVILVIAIQLLSSVMSRSQGIDLENLAASVGGWGLGSQWFLPHVWVVKAPLAMVEGYGFSLLESLVPLVVFSVGAFLISVKVAQRVFLKGWSSSREFGDAKKSKGASGKTVKSAGIGFNTFKGQFGSIFYKDLLVWKRQPVLWYGVLIAGIALAFFMFNMSAPGMDGAAEEGFSIIREMLLFMIVFMCSYSSGGLSVFSVSMDGEGIWLLKSSPISPRKYYLAKMAVVMAPGTVIAVLAIVGMALFSGLPQYPIYISLPMAIATLSVITAMQLLTDIVKPNFNLKIAGFGGGKAMNDPFKSIVLVFSSMISSVVLVALFALPSYYTFIPFLSGLSVFAVTAIAWSSFVVLVYALHVVIGRVAVRKIGDILSGR